MNRIEHLLSILAEEGSEVAQRASKAMRFGLDEVQPGHELSNEQRIWAEMADIVAVGEMLTAARGRGGVDPAAVQAKKAKVERFLEYSRQCGTLQEAQELPTPPAAGTVPANVRLAEDGVAAKPDLPRKIERRCPRCACHAYHWLTARGAQSALSSAKFDTATCASCGHSWKCRVLPKDR